MSSRPRAVEIFSERGCDVDFKPGLKPAELRAIIGNYEGLAIRSATKVTAEVLAEAKKLRVVGPRRHRRRQRRHQGRHRARRRRHEHAVRQRHHHGRACHRADVRGGPPGARGQCERPRLGKWEKNRFMGTELSFKTLGLIGCGNIGCDRGRARTWPQDAGAGLRSVPVATSVPPELGVEKVHARPGAGAGRFHHRPYAAHRSDQATS